MDEHLLSLLIVKLYNYTPDFSRSVYAFKAHCSIYVKIAQFRGAIFDETVMYPFRGAVFAYFPADVPLSANKKAPGIMRFPRLWS